MGSFFSSFIVFMGIWEWGLLGAGVHWDGMGMGWDGVYFGVLIDCSLESCQRGSLDQIFRGSARSGGYEDVEEAEEEGG